MDYYLFSLRSAMGSHGEGLCLQNHSLVSCKRPLYIRVQRSENHMAPASSQALGLPSQPLAFLQLRLSFPTIKQCISASLQSYTCQAQCGINTVKLPASHRPKKSWEERLWTQHNPTLG